jgi:hypothetical protein
MYFGMFKSPDIIDFAIKPILESQFIILVAWGTMLLEIFLGVAIASSVRFKQIMLILGLLFHSLIAVFFGLITFGISMFSALIFYLSNENQLKIILNPILLKISKKLHI